MFIVRKEDGYTYARPATQVDAAQFFSPNPARQKRFGGVELPTKVPFGCLWTALQFFTEVERRYHREDVLLLYYHEEEQKYRLSHPQIKAASAGFVDYEVPVTPTNYTCYGSFHSHGREMPYNSGVDNQDAIESPGVHVIIGSLIRGWPTLHCYFSSPDGFCWQVPPEDIFEDKRGEQFKMPTGWLQDGVPSGPRPQRVATTVQIVSPATTTGGQGSKEGGDNVSGTRECQHAACPYDREDIGSNRAGWY